MIAISSGHFYRVFFCLIYKFFFTLTTIDQKFETLKFTVYQLKLNAIVKWIFNTFLIQSKQPSLQANWRVMTFYNNWAVKDFKWTMKTCKICKTQVTDRRYNHSVHRCCLNTRQYPQYRHHNIAIWFEHRHHKSDCIWPMGSTRTIVHSLEKRLKLEKCTLHW